jgi:hypothetical protein
VCRDVEARDPRVYLFWALAYEVALHFRHRTIRRGDETVRSLFEIMDYRLTPDQFHSALAQMRAYRTGVIEGVAYAGLRALIALGLTRPLGWISRHRATLRTVLRLE